MTSIYGKKKEAFKHFEDPLYWKEYVFPFSIIMTVVSEYFFVGLKYPVSWEMKKIIGTRQT